VHIQEKTKQTKKADALKEKKQDTAFVWSEWSGDGQEDREREGEREKEGRARVTDTEDNAASSGMGWVIKRNKRDNQSEENEANKLELIGNKDNRCTTVRKEGTRTKQTTRKKKEKREAGIVKSNSLS
jgi:hypothetical protein